MLVITALQGRGVFIAVMADAVHEALMIAGPLALTVVASVWLIELAVAVFVGKR
jgi:hypothetical protein